MKFCVSFCLICCFLRLLWSNANFGITTVKFGSSDSLHRPAQCCWRSWRGSGLSIRVKWIRSKWICWHSCMNAWSKSGKKLLFNKSRLTDLSKSGMILSERRSWGSQPPAISVCLSYAHDLMHVAAIKSKFWSAMPLAMLIHYQFVFQRSEGHWRPTWSCRLRSYHVEWTPSRPIWHVKQRRDWLVPGSETSWESQLLQAFCHFWPGLICKLFSFCLRGLIVPIFGHNLCRNCVSRPPFHGNPPFNRCDSRVFHAKHGFWPSKSCQNPLICGKMKLHMRLMNHTGQ